MFFALSLPHPLLLLPLLILIAISVYMYLPQANKSPSVVSVSISDEHNFTKKTTSSITLITGLGVEGDAHLGETVQHRSRLHIRPPPANLRQVHLIGIETLRDRALKPGDIGENITTANLDLLSLPRGTRFLFVPQGTTKSHVSSEKWKSSIDYNLKTEKSPTVVLQGLRNPCAQISNFRPGLQEKFIVRDSDHQISQRLAGVMGTVEMGGEVNPGMRIVVELPKEQVPLECV